MLRAIKTLEFRVPGDTTPSDGAKPGAGSAGNEDASEILSDAFNSAYRAFPSSLLRSLLLYSFKFIL
jgi:hypothetical protein